MTELGIPIVGQYSILGVLLVAVGWVFVAILRGGLITGREQDRRDAEHEADISAERERHAAELAAANKRAEKWQEAWQAGQDTIVVLTPALKDISVFAEFGKKFMDSLPKFEGVPRGSDN